MGHIVVDTSNGDKKLNVRDRGMGRKEEGGREGGKE